LTTTTSYSSLGEAPDVTDAEGNLTSFNYQFGRVTRETDPLGRYSTFAYDLAGRQIDARSFDINHRKQPVFGRGINAG
jgi:YD repeat-containing protein